LTSISVVDQLFMARAGGTLLRDRRFEPAKLKALDVPISSRL